MKQNVKAMKPEIAVIILVSAFVMCLVFWAAEKFSPSPRTLAIWLAVSSTVGLGFAGTVSLRVVACLGLLCVYPLWRMHKKTDRQSNPARPSE